jgi:hypothetical protein
MFYRLDMQVAYPGKVFLDASARTFTAPELLPSDEMSFYLMNKGMSWQLGDHSKPSAALQANHVQYLDRSLDK